MTDSEDTASDSTNRRRRPPWGNRKPRVLTGATEESRSDAAFGSGIGLGISRTDEMAIPYPLRSTTPFSRSVSSESSSDIDPSPSRFLSARALAAKASPSLPNSSTNPHIQARRQTMVAPIIAPFRGSPASSTMRLRPVRPVLRRGVTEPRAASDAGTGIPSNGFLSVHTPFADIKPSPAAFASTGLLKKKSGIAVFGIPKFCQTIEATNPHNPVSSAEASVAVDPKEFSAYVRAAQKSRGLRRKGSMMFASGSSGSIGELTKTDCTKSPATPTKPGFRGMSLA